MAKQYDRKDWEESGGGWWSPTTVDATDLNDYQGWARTSGGWAMLRASITGAAGIATPEQIARAATLVSPQSVMDAYAAFQRALSTLLWLETFVHDQSKAIAGEGRGWQGQAATAFLTKMEGLSKSIGKQAEHISGAAGIGSINSVPSQLNASAQYLQWGQNTMAYLDQSFAALSREANNAVGSNGLVSITGSPFEKPMTEAMLKVVDTVATQYEATTSAVNSNTGLNAPTNTPTPSPSTPNISTPNISTPNISTPNISTPNISTPNISTPNISTPNISTPNISTPNISTPNISTPSLSTPNKGLPGFDTPTGTGIGGGSGGSGLTGGGVPAFTAPTLPKPPGTSGGTGIGGGIDIPGLTGPGVGGGVGAGMPGGGMPGGGAGGVSLPDAPDSHGLLTGDESDWKPTTVGSVDVPDAPGGANPGGSGLGGIPGAGMPGGGMPGGGAGGVSLPDAPDAGGLLTGDETDWQAPTLGSVDVPDAPGGANPGGSGLGGMPGAGMPGGGMPGGGAGGVSLPDAPDAGGLLTGDETDWSGVKLGGVDGPDAPGGADAGGAGLGTALPPGGNPLTAAPHPVLMAPIERPEAAQRVERDDAPWQGEQGSETEPSAPVSTLPEAPTPVEVPMPMQAVDVMRSRVPAVEAPVKDKRDDLLLLPFPPVRGSSDDEPEGQKTPGEQAGETPDAEEPEPATAENLGMLPSLVAGTEEIDERAEPDGPDAAELLAEAPERWTPQADAEIEADMLPAAEDHVPVVRPDESGGDTTGWDDAGDSWWLQDEPNRTHEEKPADA